MNYHDALAIAATELRSLAPFCRKLALVGSLRRGKAEIKDIDIVCIPKDATRLRTYLNTRLAAAEIDKRLNKNGHTIAWGEKHYSYSKRDTLADLPVDIEIFIANEQNWGYTLVIRTGGDDANKALVTQKYKGGVCRDDVLFSDGSLWWFPKPLSHWGANLTKQKKEPQAFGAQLIPTPQEIDVFRAVGLPYIPPYNRDESRYRTYAIIDLPQLFHDMINGAYIYRVDLRANKIFQYNEVLQRWEILEYNEIIMNMLRKTQNQVLSDTAWLWESPPSEDVYSPSKSLVYSVDDLIKISNKLYQGRIDVRSNG